MLAAIEKVVMMEATAVLVKVVLALGVDRAVTVHWVVGVDTDLGDMVDGEIGGDVIKESFYFYAIF